MVHKPEQRQNRVHLKNRVIQAEPEATAKDTSTQNINTNKTDPTDYATTHVCDIWAKKEPTTLQLHPT